jgi:hypothetical protein
MIHCSGTIVQWTFRPSGQREIRQWRDANTTKTPPALAPAAA